MEKPSNAFRKHNIMQLTMPYKYENNKLKNIILLHKYITIV